MKAKKSSTLLKPIDEDQPMPDDIRDAASLDEDVLPNPREITPMFPQETGPNEPPFIESIHRSKLALFGASSFDGERTLLSPRFCTMEQATYYSRVLCYKNCIFEHKYLEFTELEELSCFHRMIDQLDELHLKRILRFNHGWN